MNWIAELKRLDLSKNKYSQYGEEIIIEYILKQIGADKRYFVDIGAGGAGRNLSNTKRLREREFNGLSFDMDGSIGTIKEFITPYNIVSLLANNNCHPVFDLLSVDLDSFDYDIIDEVLSVYMPSLVCAEYNGTLDPTSCVKLQYEEGYTWDGTNKYGFSYGAGLKLFAKHGYYVVFNHADTNMFAVRADLINFEFEQPVAVKNVYHPINDKAIWINV